jgi:hypothetical protein
MYQYTYLLSQQTPLFVFSHDNCAPSIFRLVVEQYPQADGTCDNIETQSACLSKVSVFDSESHRCQWDDASNQCSFLPPEYSPVVRISTSTCYISVI